MFQQCEIILLLIFSHDLNLTHRMQIYNMNACERTKGFMDVIDIIFLIILKAQKYFYSMCRKC